MKSNMDFTGLTPNATDSAECKEILLQLITAINQLQIRNRFKQKNEQTASEDVPKFGCSSEKLAPLYQCIGRIFSHKIKLFNEKNAPDVWKVIEGLKFSNPSISLDINQTLHGVTIDDKGLLWIFQCVEQCCLSENLNWLINDNEHMAMCYESTAFLRSDQYAEAMMICFNAMERGQPALLSQINQNLYDQEHCVIIGTIKRSESHPNLTLSKNIFKPSNGKQIIRRRQTIHLSKFRSDSRFKKRNKLSRSLPNIALKDHFHAVKKKPPDCIDAKMLDGYSEPNVPSFNYTDNSVPKPGLNILNCENIKIYTESTSSSPETQGCWQRHKTIKKCDVGNRSDMFSLAALTDSSRVLLNDFIPQCGEKIIKTADSKIAGNILSDLPSRPVPGQSLTSFLKTVYFSRTNTELDRENAHFSLSEALISTFEQLKWNEGETNNGHKDYRKHTSSSNLWSSYQSSPQFLNQASKSTNSISNNVSPSNNSKGSTSTAISSFSDSGSSVGSVGMSSGCINHIKSNPDQRLDDLEAMEASECDDMKTYSAEAVALSLLSKFNEKQLPTACDLLWLVSEQDTPQQILPIPPHGQIVNPDDYIGLNTIIRGTREWAPPRPQIIFTYSSPSPDRQAQMKKQNYRCAGCGMKVAAAYSNRFRYCHYLGKYNCSGCHKNQMSALPSKVIERWDFAFHPVSTFAYHLLNDIAACPLYRINHLNPKLFEKIRILQVAQNIRLNLRYIRDFIFSCRFAEDLKLSFSHIPDHITSDLDSWSMSDFISVGNGSFQKEKMDFMRRCEKHIFNCELCIAHGFFCENCDRKEVIFPWQKRIVKCGKCGACFHEACVTPICVKCDRLLKRRSNKK
ncbi:run domain Beclin-1-interacting and cysteine-rich domain-containing protein [Toxorhynchites rutilus septentrionalis]|uniref:run domain Beclin-1-interacting and cysteine-rich domain-containing protein n=1 Tax=Toxorhynchites rutilus septentrionalis TaxID=329112 RepID=UPI00247AB0DF|nr:run domain Beclin-1-interacting and cysteine-rich domain-containing protein [Toxorhynchites rutilus septentrionalis]